MGEWPVAGLTRVADVILGASAANMDFQNIPQNFANLWILGQFRVTEVTTDDWAYIQFNNDSGANYDDNGFVLLDTSLVTIGAENAQTKAKFCEVLGSSARANDATVFQIIVPNYAGTTFNKQFNSIFSGRAASNRIDTGEVTGNWTSTAAINRITFTPTSNNILAGSRISIYGI